MSYRFKANLTLGGLFLLYLLFSLLRHFFPVVSGLKLISFVLETALIGGIADWFAVTALFQKPLGWPFHTALIPKNREKVIKSIGNMVQHDLLSLKLINQKINDISVAPNLIQWIESNGGPRQLIEKFLEHFRGKHGNDYDKLGIYLGRLIRNSLQNHSISPLLLRLFFYLHQNEELWFDYILSKLHRWAAEPQTKSTLLLFLQEQKNEKLGKSSLNKYLFSFMEKIDGLNLDDAAASLQLQLCATINELEDKNHPLRQKIDELFSQILNWLEGTQGKQNTLERWKEENLVNLAWENILSDLIKSVPTRVLLFEWLNEQVDIFWLQFKSNVKLQEKLNHFVQTLLYRISKTEHSIIGIFAKDTLQSLNNKDLIEFIQSKAGNDLQWIRINGSLVGGLIGLLLFLFLNYFYDPFVVPMWHRLLM